MELSIRPIDSIPAESKRAFAIEPRWSVPSRSPKKTLKFGGELTRWEVGDFEGNFWRRLVVEVGVPEGLGGRIDVVNELKVRDMEITREDLLRRYAAGERDFAGVTFEFGTDNLDTAILRKINLRGAEIGDITFTGVDFERANFGGAVVVDCPFFDVNLYRASFRGGYMPGCWFEGVDLSEADLSGAVLTRVTFERVKLVGADLSRTKLVSADFIDSDLTNAVFDNADLSRAYVRKTVMPDGTFREKEPFLG